MSATCRWCGHRSYSGEHVCDGVLMSMELADARALLVQAKGAIVQQAVQCDEVEKSNLLDFADQINTFLEAS